MSTIDVRALVAATAAILLVAGCGGGGGDGGPATTTVTLHSTPTIDGTVIDGVLVNTSTYALQVGDTIAAAGKRGFLRFSITGIPSGATIVSAELRVHQSFVFGSPYASLGNVVVDQVQIGTALDLGDFGAVGVVEGTLSSDASLGYKTLDVTDAVESDHMLAHPNTDFRLRTSLLLTDSDSVQDDTQWDDAEDTAGSGNVPLLVVTYQP